MPQIASKRTRKVFLDAEFTGLDRNADLISLGFVTGDGNMLYAEFVDYQTDDEWVQQNVVSQLALKGRVAINSWERPQQDLLLLHGSKSYLKGHVQRWLAELGPVAVWSDVYAYDWILLLDLLGNELPSNVNYIPLDLASLAWTVGVDPDFSRETLADEVEAPELVSGRTHNSLWDAIVQRACFKKLDKLAPFPRGSMRTAEEALATLKANGQ